MEQYSFNIWLCLASAAVGYLCGNLQTAILISKRYYHDDVRSHGSGNAGSTNMVRVFGFKPGIVTFIGDFCKAIAAVLLGRLLMGTLGGYVSALFVVLGHCYPVFAGFRGGKGVASSFAIAWVTFPLGAAITTAAAAIVLAATKKVSLVSLSGMLVFLITTLIFRITDIALVALSVILTAIVYLRHTDNIRRLLHNEEKQIVN